MKRFCSERHLFIKICGIMIFIVCQQLGSEAHCNPTSGNVRRFGTKCDLRCHCLNATEQCDMTTGACPSGCAYEWAGPGCQYKNIALEEDTRHLDNKQPYRFSILANDRSVTTCSYTGNATTTRHMAPWWAIWYPYDVTFTELDLVTLDSHLKYFSGFNVTVQQGISKDEFSNKIYSSGKLCHQHDSRTPPNTTVHVTCLNDIVGNQLRIQLANISTQLVLCDVRVYGECKDRMWGNACTNICGYCKNLEQCHVATGHCPAGCEYGYKDSLSCNRECDDGTYGSNCSSTCNNNCKYTFCNKQNGTCSYGCNPGYEGELCNHECVDGSYGYSCRHRCSANCLGVCSKVDGTCLSCKGGWKGNNCNTECAFGEWGKDCSEDCGNCLNGSCNRLDGYCRQGCMPGFKSSNMCLERCDSGTYGFDCKYNCSINCGVSYVCDAIDGACGCCIKGWKGKHCDIAYNEGETDSFLKLSGSEVAGTVVVVILLIIISIFLSVLLTVFILRRRKSFAESRCQERSENTNVSYAISYANVAAGASSNTEAGTEYETIRERKAEEHVYKSGQQEG